LATSRAAVALVLGLLVTGCADDSGSASAPTTTSAPATTSPSTSASVITTTTALAGPTYRFPVEPVGAADYSAGHHDYPASDIFCPIGSSFVAVTDGVVDHVSRTDPWDPAVDDPPTRGGLSVAIVGDDGVRYYGSHLSSVAEGIEPGVRVRAGQLLGLTGQTGNAADTAPHLHFGISHPTTPDDWRVRRGEVDPYPYLRAWAEGRDVTPPVG
jgi:peptidoglycan LD-endopeptidase LytH